MTTFRYWGEVDPRGRTKIPVLSAPAVIDGDPWALQLYEPIDSWGGDWGTSAAEFAAALRSVPADAAVTLRINSPGGEVHEAITIANLLRERAGRVDVRVDGLAASAASYLAALGDTVTMGQDTELMIHDPWTITVGDAATHEVTVARLDSMGDTLAGTYARKAGGDPASWRAVMRAERWYTAAEAVDAGLADAVDGAEADATLPAAAAAQAARWALQFTRPPGRHLAAVPAVTPPAPPAPTTTGADPAPVIDLDAFRSGILRALEEAWK